LERFGSCGTLEVFVSTRLRRERREDLRLVV